MLKLAIGDRDVVSGCRDGDSDGTEHWVDAASGQPVWTDTAPRSLAVFCDSATINVRYAAERPKDKDNIQMLQELSDRLFVDVILENVFRIPRESTDQSTD